MKVFIVSRPEKVLSVGELTQLLSRIRTSDSRATPVIAVESLHNLSELGRAPAQAEGAARSHDLFRLEHFRGQAQGAVDDFLPIDDSLLASAMDGAAAPWVVIDLGHNPLQNTEELVRKLARYNFMSDHLAERNLVLLTPFIHVGICARAVNAAFNNLPVSSIEVDRSGQIRRLLRSAEVERVIRGLPLPDSLMRRLSRLFMHLYRRLVRVA